MDARLAERSGTIASTDPDEPALPVSSRTRSVDEHERGVFEGGHPQLVLVATRCAITRFEHGATDVDLAAVFRRDSRIARQRYGD